MINKYDNVLINSISEKYRECLSRKSDMQKKVIKISTRLTSERETITHREHTEILQKVNRLHNDMDTITIEIDTWDKARELCFSLIDNNQITF